MSRCTEKIVRKRGGENENEIQQNRVCKDALVSDLNGRTWMERVERRKKEEEEEEEAGGETLSISLSF